MQRGGKRKCFLPARAARTDRQTRRLQMTRILARLTALVFAITMSITAFAGPTKTDTITLYHDAQLNGTTIPAGDYTVKCETNGTSAQVRFMKGGKEVASASGQAKELDKKAAHGQVLLQNGSIQEVDLAGSKTGVTFDSSMANAGK
jgi:hypothetical protein